MHQSSFDAIVRAAGVAPTRRHALRTVAATTLALILGSQAGTDVAAASRGIGKSCTRNAQCCSSRCAGKKGKRRCRKGKPGACLPNGRGCNTGSQCCSGHCAGKKGKETCRGVPNQSICTVRDNSCRTGHPNTDCGVGETQCNCNLTTRGHAFCHLSFGGCDNTPCASDVECVARLGLGAACITSEPDCTFFETQCCLPCPDPV